MVLDGGGQFISAGIVDIDTLSLLLASLVAHDCATEVNHTTPQERNDYRTQDYTIELVGTVHNSRQGGINSCPL